MLDEDHATLGELHFDTWRGGAFGCSKNFKLVKLDTATNLADIGSKDLEPERIRRLTADMGPRFTGGPTRPRRMGHGCEQ